MQIESVLEMLTLFTLTVLLGCWLAERLHVSAPLLLIGVGVLGSELPFVHPPALEPEFVLVGLLPPLLYAAAVNTPLVDFRRNLAPIGWLSVGLVIFTTLGVAVVVWALLGVPFAAACALGAIVAPPDAVAATAVARQVGLPRRVVSILEGESLVNDGTALVSLRTATVALGASVTAVGVAGDFLWAVFSGVAIGIVAARVGGWLFKLLPSGPMTTALSFLIPFAAFVPTEAVRGSGVIAVVAAGLALGHRSYREQDAAARVSQRMNWTTISFVLENSVFLLLGLQTATIISDAAASGYDWPLIIAVCAATFAAVIVLRLLWTMLTHFAFGRRRGNSGREGFVIGWAGMRGVVTLAAALSLPEATPARPVLVLAALAVTVGTLLLQGLTLGPLVRRLGLRGPDPREDALTEAVVVQKAATAGLEAVHAAAGPGDAGFVEQLQSVTSQRVNAIWERLGRPSDELETPSQTGRRLRLAALTAERETVLKVRDEGAAEQTVLSRVLASLDLEEIILDLASTKADAIRASEPLVLSDAAQPCEHLQAAPPDVKPASTTGCLECEAEGLTPVHLRLCLTCGHVGCCDSSEGRHATRHYEESGHPVMRSFEPGESWRWCYIDEVVSN